MALLPACAPDGDVFERQLHALGTMVTLTIRDADPAAARAASAALERRYVELGRDWYPWAPPGEGGELAAINEALGRGESIAVSPALKSLLERAAELETRSGGRFNVALGALTELWGFDDPLTEDWRPPSQAAIDALLAGEPGSAQLEWDGRTLTSGNPELVIDPGGIAKGAILAISAELLAKRGIGNAIVDLGGDLTVLGRVDGRAARIGIRDPAGGAPPAHIDAEPGESVLTSGNYERYFDHDGERYGHVLDPRTGRPATGARSATVVARDPVLADAAATALLVAGPEEFDATCRALGVEYALLIDARGDVRLTEGMRGRVHFKAR